MDKPNYYAVIPATVRYDSRLTGDEKILFGEITALTQKEGYCWANNEYFANLYGVHKQTISKWVNNLKDYKHIETEIDKLGNRKIYISKVSAQTLRDISPNAQGGIGANAEHNNTSINNTKNIEADASKVPSFEEYLEQNTTSDYEGDGEVSQLVYRRAGRVVSEKSLRREYDKLYPAPRETPVKAPRTRDRFDFDTWLGVLENSPKKVEKIIAFVWKERGYRFDNYEQWRARMGQDVKFARQLEGYSPAQVKEVIDGLHEEERKLGYKWSMSTIAKRIANTTL